MLLENQREREDLLVEFGSRAVVPRLLVPIKDQQRRVRWCIEGVVSLDEELSCDQDLYHRSQAQLVSQPRDSCLAEA